MSEIQDHPEQETAYSTDIREQARAALAVMPAVDSRLDAGGTFDAVCGRTPSFEHAAVVSIDARIGGALCG